MVNNKSKRGNAGRHKVADSEGYEVGHLAKKHDISRDQARRLIGRIGNNRDKLDAAAEKLKNR